MTGRGYGQFFLAALPAMAPTRDRDDALRFIRKHAPRDLAPARLATQL
jgi:hypothetical protein